MIIFTPSLFFQYDICPHWIWHDRFSDPKEKGELPELTLKLFEQGVLHESEYIKNLDFSPIKAINFDSALIETLEAMRKGVNLIYQGAIQYEVDDVIYRGRPDLLKKLPGKSKFGNFYYFPIDIKSSKEVKKEQKFQLTLYSIILENLQGCWPEKTGIINRDFENIEVVIFNKDKEDTIKHIDSILDIIKGQKPPLKLVSTCKSSPWYSKCEQEAEAVNDIALIYRLDVRSHPALRQLGINTIFDVAKIDVNVLPFKVDYVSTVREAENIEDKKVSDIDREAILSSSERLQNIVGYICEHFDQKTKRNSFYKIKERRLAGFNSIFAVSSIDVAKKYYAEFKKQLTNLPSDKRLKVALIYSFGVNDEDADGMIDESSEDTSGLDASSRDFLEGAIVDYNAMFGTSYDTSSDKFQNYYKDVSQRVKDREIDILIVVNMFLTGFDATTLNTLWVDKNLRLHGLLQAYSRTNRILNSVKTFGNIICFRNLEKATNESISLFGDKEASGIVLLKSYAEYYNGYKDGDKEVRGYTSLVAELMEKYPIGERIASEQAQKDFIKLYGGILRLRNILTTFDEFAGNEILTERDVKDYHSMYIDLYNEFRKTKEDEKENVNDDVVFEMELIKQVDINIDYILGLIKKYHEDHIKNREILIDINKAIDSSVELRNKKDLINQFISSLDIHSIVDEDWQKFMNKKKIEELEQIIKSENLDYDATYAFIKNAFRDGSIATSGTAITKVLPPVSRFSQDGERTKKRETVLTKLINFFERFFDISGGKFSK